MNCPEYLQRDLSEKYGTSYANSACALCAIACASSALLNDSSITPEKAISDGVATKTSPAIKNWSKYCNISSLNKVTQAKGLKVIYGEVIDNDRPVIIYLYSSHYVVAYNAISSSAETATPSDIYVLDPWDGYTTLQDVYDNLSKTWVGYRTVKPQ